jgi:hypothetical protein
LDWLAPVRARRARTRVGSRRNSEIQLAIAVHIAQSNTPDERVPLSGETGLLDFRPFRFPVAQEDEEPALASPSSAPADDQIKMAIAVQIPERHAVCSSRER